MSSPLFLVIVSALFFLSGAAALVYQVVWVRSLTLVFGGTHLAVTAVLSIFMGGLAIGGYAIGRRVDHVERPLRLYGLLELGIAAFAIVFVGLMRIYPSIYVAVARGRDDATLYLLVVRMLFSVAALIVPTVLMGGTLPVLSRVISRGPDELRRHLSSLYAVNTLGAVCGALLAGFFLLRVYSVSTSLYVAVAVNAFIGLVSLALREEVLEPSDRGGDATACEHPASAAPTRIAGDELGGLPVKLVLWGIGVSGFCALGYEVLWTRVLTIGIGASVYGFTVILVAFLAGIALGSEAYGLVLKAFGRAAGAPRRLVAWFGVTQVVIGVSALVVTIYLRDIPAHAVWLQSQFLGSAVWSFTGRAWASFVLAFMYVVVPAGFMGAAFPLAGEVQARHRKAVGRGVGEVLSSNTIGAVLGASVSGLVLIRIVGIERSLQILTILNIGWGLLVLASLRRPRWLTAGVAVATLAVISFLGLNPTAMRVWDPKYFAVFRSNQPEAFTTPAMVEEAVENTDVLYYAEGVESSVSVIKIKGGEQSFITNGRVEASSHPQALQVQYTLGHLPMLLNRHPTDVLVVGMGSGMTAGATAAHASLARVTLVEIEPKVLGVARTFAAYNHDVLDNPKLEIVLNDGRNFLTTTNRTFDVITADPIHPWFRGAGYLYTSEYFALVAAHLRPGGVVAQWLPLYELTPEDVRSVVKTFQRHFAYTMMWLNHVDAEIVGSNAPFTIDEDELERRISEPAVSRDLTRVTMGSATDFLSYFVMGTEAMARFAEGGTVNTDDNLYLEFSAPFSFATPSVMAANVKAITSHRESLLPYLVPAADPQARSTQKARWDLQLGAARLGDPALALLLANRQGEPGFGQLLEQLDGEYAWYAPGRFLRSEYLTAMSLEPRPIQQMSLTLMDEAGATTAVDMSAVLVPLSKARASIMFVDGRARVIYGQLFVDEYARDDFAARFAADVMAAVRAIYDDEAVIARQRGRALPSLSSTLTRVKAVVASKVQGARRDS